VLRTPPIPWHLGTSLVSARPALDSPPPPPVSRRTLRSPAESDLLRHLPNDISAISAAREGSAVPTTASISRRPTNILDLLDKILLDIAMAAYEDGT
jgi:hypothetical protein